MQLDHAAVGDRMERLVADVRPDGAHRPAVRDEQETAAGVHARDPLDGRKHTGSVLLARLATRALDEMGCFL